MLLATFLHELAHTVTQPEMRRAGTIPKEVLALQNYGDEVKVASDLQFGLALGLGLGLGLLRR